MTALADQGRRLFAADDAAQAARSDRRLTNDQAGDVARAIIIRAEMRAEHELAGADVWEPEAAVLRAQALLVDRMARDWPEHGSALSEAAGELRNAAGTIRRAVQAIRERAAEAA